MYRDAGQPRQIFATDASSLTVVKPARGKSAASSKSSSTSLLSKATSLNLDEKTKAKIWDSIKMVVVALPPLAAVVCLSIMMMTKVGDALAASTNLNTYLGQALLLNALAIGLQKERGITCVFVTSTAKDGIVDKLYEMRNNTDKAIADMRQSWSAMITDSSRLYNASYFQDELHKYRSTISEASAVSACEQSIEFYSPLVDTIMYNMAQVFYNSKEGIFWGAFAALRNILALRETLGLKRLTGGTFYSQGSLSPDMYQFFIGWPHAQRPSAEQNGASKRMLKLVQTSDNEVGGFMQSQLAELSDLASLIDNMTTYIIREKISELHVEKDRSEKLLYSMLPKSIAKSLKMGQVILPKTYSEATVYFSDIKGFTTICSTSSPLEVVTLLNELYTTMDNVLDNYNCYKVETIGDAYMVVSGIPKTNGYDHSMEIATMALHMLQEISALVVPHRPTERLKMRIGVNSGPCAAGIVGLKMPRYCLFGDTVNTASRMESTGMPMRIQLSEATAAHLRKHFGGQFELVPRGKLEIKGKGRMHTVWLKSRRGFPFVVDLSAEDAALQQQKSLTEVEVFK